MPKRRYPLARWRLTNVLIRDYHPSRWRRLLSRLGLRRSWSPFNSDGTLRDLGWHHVGALRDDA
jgi:hypothetical protein